MVRCYNEYTLKIHGIDNDTEIFSAGGGLLDNGHQYKLENFLLLSSTLKLISLYPARVAHLRM